MGTGTLRAVLRRTQVETVDEALDRVIDEATAWLSRRQGDDGHWVFELEADASIPAEYVLFNHALGEINDCTERKIGVYLRRIQGPDGGWPLYHEGEGNLSSTVKAYLALKLIGDDAGAAHMRRAREFVLAQGGAAKANVFTRFLLALYRQVPWRAVPAMPIETLLLPRWLSPFQLDRVSYWSRTVMVPLFIIYALKPKAQNPRGVGIGELFREPPEKHARYQVNPTGSLVGDALLLCDAALRRMEPMMPSVTKKQAIDRAVRFIEPRLNGADGLGGIFPAMYNAAIAFAALGYGRDHPYRRMIREACERLVVMRDREAYVQPCVSPVWDTSLIMHTLLEGGVDGRDPRLARAAEWLRQRQILDGPADWQANRGHVRPGGWAFQYRNDYYPDVDDTAVVVMALHRADPERNRTAIERGAEWIIGMQSRNGGWGAFDADNEYEFLNNIPFADHGALLDPPTADVTARCLGMLAQLGYRSSDATVARAITFLRREQEADGSWFGRWGTNYIYGTWSVLCALNAAGEDMGAPYIRRAVDWLKARQRPDGGWGEDCASYYPERRNEVKASTPSQTAWALLALMAAGEIDCDAVDRGIAYLLAAPRDGGKWHEELYNAVGFPRVFYLRYHGYSAYFPLWALARYRALKRSNDRRPVFGL